MDRWSWVARTTCCPGGAAARGGTRGRAERVGRGPALGLLSLRDPDEQVVRATPILFLQPSSRKAHAHRPPKTVTISQLGITRGTGSGGTRGCDSLSVGVH